MASHRSPSVLSGQQSAGAKTWWFHMVACSVQAFSKGNKTANECKQISPESRNFKIMKIILNHLIFLQ
jgi:hypothetical protein